MFRHRTKKKKKKKNWLRDFKFQENSSRQKSVVHDFFSKAAFMNGH